MNRTSLLKSPVAGALPTPASLPPQGDPRRWPALQRLRRLERLDPGPWLEAIEAQALSLQADLVTILVDHLDGDGAWRLLLCWLSSEPREAAIPPLLGCRRDPDWAGRLRSLLRQADRQEQIWLLPLLGHQADPLDFPLLCARLVEPGPLAWRLAALEGLSVGLRAWPLAPLRAALCGVAEDLQPQLAGGAVDLLARLPGARVALLRLLRRRLDPGVERRVQRRLSSLPAAPLLLLVHGRAGGVIPAELQDFAAELARLRGAEVRLLALSDPAAPRLPVAEPLAVPPTLVPLLLLPGGHVRRDLPALAATLAEQGPLRRLPFLGSWPLWQEALATELRALAVTATAAQTPPLLLHHPLEGRLAERYLAMLAGRCRANCRPAAFSGSARQAEPEAWAPEGAFLPLALAANRLTESLQASCPAGDARPLLARPRLRQILLEALLALP